MLCLLYGYSWCRGIFRVSLGVFTLYLSVPCWSCFSSLSSTVNCRVMPSIRACSPRYSLYSALKSFLYLWRCSGELITVYFLRRRIQKNILLNKKSPNYQGHSLSGQHLLWIFFVFLKCTFTLSAVKNRSHNSQHSCKSQSFSVTRLLSVFHK